VCALHCAQLLHTILHRTDLIIFPLTLDPDNHHSSGDVYLREGGLFSVGPSREHQSSPNQTFWIHPCHPDSSRICAYILSGRPFAKRFALCYLSVVCLSVCPVCLWRWCIVAKRVDRSICHLVRGRHWPRPRCVRWRPSSPPPKKGHIRPVFGPCLLRPNGRPSQPLLSTCFEVLNVGK